MVLDTTPSVAQIQSISSSISVGGGSQIFLNVFRIFMKHMDWVSILNETIYFTKSGEDPSVT